MADREPGVPQQSTCGGLSLEGLVRRYLCGILPSDAVPPARTKGPIDLLLYSHGQFSLVLGRNQRIIVRRTLHLGLSINLFQL